MCLVAKQESAYLYHMTETMNDKEYEQDCFSSRAAVAAIALFSCPRKHLK